MGRHPTSGDMLGYTCPAGGRVIDVTLKQQLSNVTCIKNEGINYGTKFATFGCSGTDVMVLKGCNGIFTGTFQEYVYYYFTLENILNSFQ